MYLVYVCLYQDAHVELRVQRLLSPSSWELTQVIRHGGKSMHVYIHNTKRKSWRTGQCAKSFY